MIIKQIIFNVRLVIFKKILIYKLSLFKQKKNMYDIQFDLSYAQTQTS